MEEVVAIHANDITGRPCSVRPCNTNLEESNIGCGPVLIDASDGAAVGVTAVSGTTEKVRHLSHIREGAYKPYTVVHVGMAISNYILVWQLQQYKDKTK